MSDPKEPLSSEQMADYAQFDERNLPSPTRSGGSARPDYDDPITRQREEQAYLWSGLLFKLKVVSLVVVFFIAIVATIGIAIVVGFLVILALIHYTIPSWGWLSSDELSRLSSIYGNFAKFAAPAAMITNAWLVAYFGTRRWRGQDRN